MTASMVFRLCLGLAFGLVVSLILFAGMEPLYRLFRGDGDSFAGTATHPDPASRVERFFQLWLVYFLASNISLFVGIPLLAVLGGESDYIVTPIVAVTATALLRFLSVAWSPGAANPLVIWVHGALIAIVAAPISGGIVRLVDPFDTVHQLTGKPVELQIVTLTIAMASLGASAIVEGLLWARGPIRTNSR